MTPPIRFLRKQAVRARTGLATSTMYLRIKEGRFPRPVPLGGGGAVGWVESEIDEWCAAQVRAARPESTVSPAT